MTNNPKDNFSEAFKTHLQDQRQAAAAHAEKVADDVYEVTSVVRDKKYKKAEYDNFYKTYLGTKFKWLTSVKEYAKEDIRICPHIEVKNPGISFINLFFPTAFGCPECIQEKANLFNEQYPNNCDFCFEESEVFHETMVQTGYFLIFGNICTPCHEKQYPVSV
jgi:hypothetical protein